MMQGKTQQPYLTERRVEWRENWTVVLAAFLGQYATMVHIYSMGLMIAPIEAAFGWTRTTITSGLLIASLIEVPLAPFMGVAIDRFGPRRIALVGLVLYCSAFAALSLAQPVVWIWWLFWAALGLSHIFVIPVIWVTAVSTSFSKSRALAIGATMTASALMSLSAPLITYFLIDEFGWRMTFILWASLAGGLAFPAVYMFFRSPKDQVNPAFARLNRSEQPTERQSVRALAKSPIFIEIAIAGLLMATVSAAFVVTLVPLLTSFGMSRGTAAEIASLVAVTQLIGRLAAGWLLDRFDPERIGALIMALPIIPALIFIGLGDQLVFATVGVLMLGFSLGAEVDVIAYLSSRHFSAKIFGTVFGTISGLWSLGAGIGPVIASLIYDKTGNYLPFLWAVVPTTLLVALLIHMTGSCPPLDADEPECGGASIP